MSNPRLPTFKLRQIIQFESSELSAREVARALNLSHGAISKYRFAVRAAGVSWDEAQRLDDVELERRIWKARAERKPRQIVLPDCATIHTELKRHKHVTLQLLWEEYHATHGTMALRYSSYCERYRHWVRRLQRSMRQRHYAGEKLFVDYAGATVPIYDSTCEEAYRAAIFVGALGASGYAYAEATRTASLPDWLGSHVRMLTFYGHAPTILVPDNPRVGVTKADRYEPELQRSYEEMAAHYSIAVIPARPYRPKDKAIVEGLVKILCRYIRFRFRRSRFTSIAEINRALMVCVERINDQRHRRFGVSRRERFEALEKAALKALPTTEYDGGEWKDAKLHPDCFLAVEVDYYSAPHIHRHKTLRIKLTEHQVEIFLDLERLANHGRAAGRKSASTATTLGSEPAGRAARSVWLSV